MKHIITLFFALLSLTIFAQEDHRSEMSYPAMSGMGTLLGKIPPLRSISPRTDFKTGAPGKLFEKRNYFLRNDLKNEHPMPQNGDPLVVPPTSADRGGGPEIIPGFNFEGLHDPSGVYPPDPTGDIGKNHYMQMVNSNGGAWFQVWDKETGNTVYGPALTSTIWSQVSTGSFGDPIVQYDHDAERWIVMELQGGNSLLIAISDDSDPTGGWKAYNMQTLGFPDYPKLYIWNNAYFITVNEIVGSNKCSGYALNRADLLAGEPEFDIYRFEMPNFQAIQFQPATGADWEGGPPPPPGSPAYIFRLYDDAWDGGQDHLESWELYVDWTNINLSHLDGPSLIYPQPFETRVCFGATFTWDCIEQPPGGPNLAALENTIMYRAPYRNFGDHESVVFNHISDVSGIVGNGGDAEVRWYELRKTGGGDWQLYQQGTYAPDLQTNRFMGTISMDEAGNIGLGYSGCSQNLFPGLYLTGQRNGDPLGDMTLEEYTLAAGSASHQTSRWGDYSSMVVDPYDGRTFWFTGEYQPNDFDTWGTRIGSFKVQRDTYDIKPTVLVAPVPTSFLGNNEQVKVRINNGGLASTDNVTVSLYFENTLVVTDNIAETIEPGTSLDHTFSQTVAMPQPGKNYKFRVVTHWNKDQFTRNDSITQVVQKLTSNDAAMAGKFNLPGLVCGTETDFSIILKNASGVPMQSAKINWRINTQAWQVYNWTGTLPPGGRDTIELHATGINNGLNGLRAITSLPNGLQDEKINNDSLVVKFYGNTDGTYLTAAAETNSGMLHWELRTQTDAILAQGDVSEQQPTAQICSDDSQCYHLGLRASSFNWNGHFVLKNIFGTVLAEISEASTQEQVFTVCTPARQQVDFGALALTTPISGQNLSAAEPITVQFRNFGLTQQSNASVSYRLNGGNWITEIMPGPFGPGQTIAHTFATTEDLSTTGAAYHFDLRATVAGDQNLANDTISANVFHRYVRELSLLNIDKGTACGDSTFAFVNILVRNNGLGNEHTFDVKYSLNGVPQPTIPLLTLFAEPDQSEIVPLYIPNLKNGTNNLVLSIGNVDGIGADEVPANDESSIVFEIDPRNQLLELAFSTDSKPAESTWDIVDSQNNILFSGGPYANPLSFNLENTCLRRDSCYQFRLHDAGGDGMPGGYVAVSIGGFTIFEYSGDNFGTELSIPFCATAFCADLVLTANITPASGAGNNDGQIEAVVAGGNPPFVFFLNNGDLQESPLFSNLSAGTYNLICLDVLGCSRELILTLGAVPTVEPDKIRNLNVSPNPTQGVAHVVLPAMGDEKNALCEVYDGHGKLVQTARMSRWDNTLRGNIALDFFPAGVYYLRVVGLNKVYGTRIIKK